MPSRTLRLAAALVLALTQSAIVERACARSGAAASGSGGHSSGGHDVGGRGIGSHIGEAGHFAHSRFGHRLRRNPFFGAPFGWGWDWPYADYGEAPSAAATSIVAYPPPLWSGYRADTCRWNDDTFTVPSSAGGKRAVEVVSCR